METNQHVVEFLETIEPTKEQMVKAYIVRDEFLNLQSSEYLVKHMNKLGYNLIKITEYSSNEQKKYVMKELENNYEEYIKTGSSFANYNIIIDRYQNSEEYKKVQERVEHSIHRFEELSKLLEGSNLDFYNALTNDELINLGW